MSIVTISNLKGGVGKTSTCFHLSGALSRRNRKVLLVDNDPQASLTQGFWGSNALAKLPRERTIFEVYQETAAPTDVIHPTNVEGVSLIPGHVDCGIKNKSDPADWIEDQDALRYFLQEISGSYDHVLVDCPPNLYLCTHAALMASDHVLVPLQPEDFGAQGIREVKKAVLRAESPPILGYLINEFNGRLNIHKSFARALREGYGPLVFRQEIPSSTDLKEAVARRSPISKGESKAFLAFEGLADEFESRLKNSLSPKDEEVAA